MGHTGCCCSAAAAPLGPEDWEQIAGRHAETVSRVTWPHVGYRVSVAQMGPSVIAKLKLLFRTRLRVSTAAAPGDISRTN